MAGYPWGVWNSGGKRGYEFASTLLAWLDVEAAFYFWLVGTALATPLLVALSSWILGLGRAQTAVVLVCAVLACQFEDMVAYFWTFGNVGFTFASALSLLCCSLLFRAVSARGGAVSASLGGVAAGLVFWLQTYAMVPAALGTLAVLATQGRRALSGAAWLRLGVAGMGFALVVLPWVRPLLLFLDARSGAIPALEAGVKHFIMDFFSDRAYRHPFDRRAVFHVVVVLAALGTWFARKRGQRNVLGLGLASSLIILSVYTFSSLPLLRETQPYRFYVSFVLYAVIPASIGLREAGRMFLAAGWAGRIPALCAAAALAPSLTAGILDVVGREPASGLGPDQNSVCDLIRGRPEKAGRVICEDGMLGNMLPHRTGRQVIGGLISEHAPLRHAWASVGQGQAFCKYGARRQPRADEWRRYLRLYDVAFVVTCSLFLRDVMRQLDDVLAESASFGSLTVFEAREEGRSRLWEGEDAGTRVAASPNAIAVENAPRGLFVLKYHYLKTLVCSAGARISPRRILDDPVPFIEVQNPSGLKDILIWNEYP
jgi:hypothetical protein